MKPPRTVYFDESGYTGTDLLNPDQPYFTVASADLDDHEARTILYQSFPDYKGKEFKSARMYHRPKSRARLVAFSQQLAQIRDRALVYICDKKFAVFLKAVDALIEPIFRAQRQDFYSGGFNRRYANMFCYALRRFATTDVYDAIVRWYDEFSPRPQ